MTTNTSSPTKGQATAASPTLNSSRQSNLRDVLKQHLPRSGTYAKSNIRNRADESLSNEPPEQVSPSVDRLARFLVAFLGEARCWWFLY